MRAKYPTRRILLRGAVQVEAASTAVLLAPVDPDNPVEVIIREQVKARHSEQNRLYWHLLGEIAEQAYIEGRTYSADVWHIHFKRVYLPEEFDPELCKDGYRKWDYTPTAERVLVGSTTGLTVRGFSEYTQQVEAEGASMGVLFSAPPRAA